MSENEEVIDQKQANVLIPVEIKASLALKGFTYIATIISFSLLYLVQYTESGSIPGAIGGGTSSILLGGIILGLFRLSKKFKNQNASYKVFLFTQLLFIVSSFGNFLKIYG